MNKILIGTPVHECKDYAMERWLKSLYNLDYPFDLLMVDNSPNSKYLRKINYYCKKYGIKNYQLVHLDFDKNSSIDERLSASREVIRQAVLAKNYDAWCSLECDVIVPTDALTKLINLLEDYWMVSHAYPARDNPEETNVEFGLSLIKRQALLKYGFAGQYGYVDPLRPNSYYGNDVWFIRRLNRDNEGKHIHVYGTIRPIYHLNE